MSEHVDVPLDWDDDQFREESAVPDEDQFSTETAGTKKERESVATKIVQAIEEHGGVELFHDGREPYAGVVIDGARDVMGIGSRAFRLFATRVYYKVTGKGPSAQSVKDALTLLEAKALFDGTDHKVYTGWRQAPMATFTWTWGMMFAKSCISVPPAGKSYPSHRFTSDGRIRCTPYLCRNREI